MITAILFSTLAFAAVEPLHITMKNAEGKEVGNATISENKRGVKFAMSFSDLPPGTHALHVHEIADCTGPDFTSAGSHFAPGKSKHGKVPGGPHEGDLPNITIGPDGKGSAVYVSKVLTIKDGKDNSLVGTGGKSLVMHAKADDHKTQPAGDSGDRIACGVIKEEKSPGL